MPMYRFEVYPSFRLIIRAISLNSQTPLYYNIVDNYNLGIKTVASDKNVTMMVILFVRAFDFLDAGIDAIV